MFNETNTTCTTTYSAKVYLDQNQRHILIAFDFLIMVGNLLLNGLAASLIIITKQLNNPSFYLIFFLSVSDMILAVSVQPLFAIMLFRFSEKTHCHFEMVAQFVAILLTHTSAYTIAVIAYDRYCRMKYLNKYGDRMKSCIIKTVFVFIILLSFSQATLYVLGTQLSFFHQAKIVAVSIDMCIASSVFVVYYWTIRVVRNHRCNELSKDLLLTVDRVVTNIAAKIVLAVVVFYLPYIITASVYSRFNGKVNGDTQKLMSFMVFVGFILTYCNTIANAVIFLTLNKKTKLKIMEILKRKKSNSIQMNTRVMEING